MKVSLGWLKKFVAFDEGAKWLAEELTMTGLEVDSQEKVALSDGKEDLVFEIGLTPNRADCLSVFGIAREIAAISGNPLKDPWVEIDEKGEAVDGLTSVTLDEPGLCPRYLARVITGVNVGPSPDWLVDFLKAIGQRSVNNVVDVTNFVMFELGSPLHAFDYDKLAGNRIVIRKAGQGETFKAIDGAECRLHEDVLVISDSEKAVALAGIMGGMNSEVNNNTKNILLECAYFDPALIRKTSKEYKIHSESSHRFERGTDPSVLDKVIDYAASIIAQLSGGIIAKGRIDKYPDPVLGGEIDLRVTRVNSILGVNLKQEEIKRYLKLLSFDIRKEENGKLTVLTPTFRTDVTREIDLIEEVARMNGYNKVISALPVCAVTESNRSALSLFKRKVKNILTGFGFQEIITYSFINSEYYNNLQLPDESRLRNFVSILNPISQELNTLRTTLLPSMLETIAGNMNSGTVDLALFEVGKVFQDNGPGRQPHESVHLVCAMTEKEATSLWGSKDTARDFYSIKGTLQAFWERIHAETLSIEQRNSPYFMPGKSVSVHAGDVMVGEMGEIHPRVTDYFKVGQRIFLFELNLDVLCKQIKSDAVLQPIPRFPSTLRDISIVVSKAVKAGDILKAISDSAGATLKEVSIFDKFDGGNIPDGSQSLTFSLVFRSDASTLMDEQIDELQEKIIENLGKKFQAGLR